MRIRQKKWSALVALSMVPSLGLLGCDSSPAIDRSRMHIHQPARIEGSPDVPEYSVWRPFFKTDAGNVSSGTTVGTAFLAQPYAEGKTYLVTAAHLYGTATGLSRDIRPSEWASAIQSTHVGDAFGATDAIKAVGAPLTPVDADSEQQRWVDLDIIALNTGPNLNGNAFKFSNESVHTGQRLWLVTALFAGASASQKCHAVTVNTVDPSGSITYTFKNAKISFRATEGAPLLFDSGAIAGIHLRGRESQPNEGSPAGNPTGSGLNSEALRSALTELSATQGG